MQTVGGREGGGIRKKGLAQRKGIANGLQSKNVEIFGLKEVQESSPPDHPEVGDAKTYLKTRKFVSRRTVTRDREQQKNSPSKNTLITVLKISICLLEYYESLSFCFVF